MKRKGKILFLMVVIISLIGTTDIKAETQVPYYTYNYDYWGNIVYTPAAYLPEGSVSGLDLGTDGFKNPQDFFLTGDKIYIADTDNNRIVILNLDLELLHIIDSFIRNGETDFFKKPRGIHVTEQGDIYIADSGNKRIVVLNKDNDFIKVVDNPESEVLPDDFSFVPMKVSVDLAGRIYVIAENMFQGIMTFDDAGNFTGFTGTIKVNITPFEIFWRRFSTKEQRARQKQFVPTEFTGIDTDKDGFLYTTNIDSKGSRSVRLLNPKGQDVIQTNDRVTLSGDLFWRDYGEYSGASRITDVVDRGSGMFSILDSLRGRIFTYDQEGNLLYIFGGLGTQVGTFRLPTAIEAMGDKLYVLDAGRNAILTFTETRYGALINDAVSLRYDGDESLAVKKWEEVLKLDSNFEQAYIGIGKAYLSAGDNKKAMEYLKLGMDKEYYSIAYKRYRNELLTDNLEYVLTGGIITFLAVTMWKKFRKRRSQHESNE